MIEEARHLAGQLAEVSPGDSQMVKQLAAIVERAGAKLEQPVTLPEKSAALSDLVAAHETLLKLMDGRDARLPRGQIQTEPENDVPGHP